MTIESRNIPNASEILEYVPSSTYVKNQVSNNRRIVKISPDNNNLRGSTFPNNAIANFTIPYSTNTLLNLSECYFDVSGFILPYLNNNPVANNQHIEKFKAGPFWLLPCIQRATLKIGGEVIYDNLLPFRTGKFKEMMYYDYNDKKNQTLEYQNIPAVSCDGILAEEWTIVYSATNGINSDKFNAFIDFFVSTLAAYGVTATATHPPTISGTNVDAQITAINTDLTSLAATIPGYTVISITATGAAASNISNAQMNTIVQQLNQNILAYNKAQTLKFKNLEIFGITNVDTTPTFQEVLLESKYKLNFQQYLKLSDLFACEGMKPIFGQSVVITLNFESAGFNGIAVDSQDTYNNFLIESFTQFNFNSITYNLNVDMVNKLNQIYSKPVLEIIDDIQVWDGPLLNAKANNTIQLKVPMNVNFETDMCCIILPQSVSNTLQLKQKFSTTHPNTTNHTIMDYRFCNYTRIDVYADSDLIYTHNYADSTVYPGDMIIDVINQTRTGPSTEGHVNINNFIPAYHLYKECRWCCGSDEKGAIPFDDFLTSGFMICIPMSAFSRISTSAQLQINISFGDGVNEGEINYPSMIQIVKDRSELINNIRVITKAKKGIVFEQLDKCSLKTITQSFDQDINIEMKTE